MAQRQLDLRKIFQPSDTIAFVVIVIGLFIALFLDEMAVRLIGVCITILGGVGLFMMVSPRLSDLSLSRPPRPSESPSFMSETRQDALKKSQIFDSIAFRATFGGVDSPEDLVIDERQIELFPELMTRDESMKESDTPKFPTGEIGDAQSSVVILGTKRPTRRSAREPELAIQQRVTKAAAAVRAPSSADEPTGSDVPVKPLGDAVISGPVNEEIQLSDDVIVRPKASAQTPEEQPTPQPPARPVEQPTPISRPVISASSYMLEPDDEMEASEEPRKEFDFLLNRVLMVIRSVIPARTAAFFWFNKEKQQLVLEAKITDAPADITDKRKLPIGYDVVSQIALEGRPEILTQISPAAELDLLPYYKYKPGTKSFIGVPVYYKGNVVGVLCADAAEEDAYNDVTVGFFGHFTKLISGLVTSYTTKFDLQHSARRLDALQIFKDGAADRPTESGVVDALFDTLIQYVDVSTIGVCTYDKDARRWIVSDARSVVEGYDDLIGQGIDINSSLVGQALRNGELAVFGGTDSVRVIDGEYPLSDGQFVVVPLRSEERTYGALYIENLQASLSQQDFALAELLCDAAGDMIERFRQKEQLASGAIVESETDLLNKEGIHRRLREEFSRSTDYQSPLSVCLIRVDPMAGQSESEQARQQVVNHLTERIREQVRDYDIIGRYDDETLVVGLPAYRAQEAQFWVEGLRRDFASSPLDINGRRLSVTVSVGIAEAVPSDTWDSLIQHASVALDISSKQQNKVTVFS